MKVLLKNIQINCIRILNQNNRGENVKKNSKKHKKKKELKKDQQLNYKEKIEKRPEQRMHRVEMQEKAQIILAV